MATKRKSGPRSQDGPSTSLVFPRMRRAAQQSPPEWFAEGRDPWRDLYSPEVLEGIGRKVGLNEPEQLDELGVLLCLAAQQYLVFVECASSDVGLELKREERAKWVDRNLIEPARILIAALDRPNDRYLSEWPSPEIEFPDESIPPPQWWLDATPPQWWLESGKMKDGFVRPSLRALGPRTYRELWSTELNRLIAWALTKKASFGQGGKPGKKSRTRYREELVYDLLVVYVHIFSDQKPTRASHGPTEKGERQGSSRIQSEFAEFVRASAAPVLGLYENLDNQIQKAIERYKTEKTELWMRPHFFI
jgi:hypothetical protein